MNPTLNVLLVSMAIIVSGCAGPSKLAKAAFAKIYPH